MQRVDYDQIAHLYDEPLRDHGVDANLLAFFDERPDLPPAQARILDVGCGTGKQLSADRGSFPGTFAVGLDPSGGMLRLARRRAPDVAWVRGDGSALPLRAGRFDYACSQFSYHHIRDTHAMIREVFRLLRPGGRFVMTNIDPWSMEGWIIYRFFPDAREVDERHFVPANGFVALMREVGFVNVQVMQDHRLVREDLRQLLAYARQRHRASQFMALTDEAYEDGIRRIEAAVADTADDEPAADSEFCLLTISGDNP